MEKSHSNASITSIENLAPMKMMYVVVPSQLKFLLNNIKTIIRTLAEYPLWKSQISKIFSTKKFDKYVDRSMPSPKKNMIDEIDNVTLNLIFNTWMLIDQNLAATLYSTNFPSLLPYVLNLDSCTKI